MISFHPNFQLFSLKNKEKIASWHAFSFHFIVKVINIFHSSVSYIFQIPSFSKHSHVFSSTDNQWIYGSRTPIIVLPIYYFSNNYTINYCKFLDIEINFILKFHFKVTIKKILLAFFLLFSKGIFSKLKFKSFC